jgi:hypothetical protein
MSTHIQNLSEIKNLESQIHVKKENYKTAIRLGKEFEELKVLHLEVKKLEKELETYKAKNDIN